MAPLIKYDQQGREYRCYTPGQPLRYASMKEKEFDPRAWQPDPDDAIPWHDELVIVDDRGLRHYYSSAGEFAAIQDGRNARQEIMTRAREYQNKNNVDFKVAVRAVLDGDEDLKTRYAKSSGWTPPAGE